MPKRKGKQGSGRMRMFINVIIIALLIPTGAIFGYNMLQGPPVQLDLTLTLQSTSNDLQYSAVYKWTADGIQTNTSSVSISWNSMNAAASVTSSGQLTHSIRSYFDDILISFDHMVLGDEGDWDLEVRKNLCSGVTMGLDIVGTATEVTSISPLLTISFVPSQISSALQAIGVDGVRVDVKIAFHIRGDIVEEAARSFGILIDFYTGFFSKVVEYSLGTISALTE